MKKMFFILTAFMLSLPVSAEELYKPHRIVDLGLDVSAGVSNNAMSLNEIFQKELVFDIEKITGELGNSGFYINDSAASDVFLNLNINEYFRFSFFGGLDTYGQFNISKSLFEMLNTGDIESNHFDAKLNQDVFITAGTAFSTKINRFRMTIGVNAFSPVLHAELSGIDSGTRVDDNGTTVWAKGKLNVYAFDDMERLKKGQFDVAKLFRGTGFDVDLSTEFPIIDSLQMGIFTHLPVVPGKLFYNSSANIDVTASVGTLDKIISGNPGNVNSGNTEFVTTEETLSINRPLRLGAELAWRPFGSWFTLRPMLAMGVKYPFSDRFLFYPEYSLGAELSLKNVLGFGISTAYLRQVFIHEMDVMMNFRVIELDAGISIQSADFLKSFTARGIGAKIAVKFGW